MITNSFDNTTEPIFTLKEFYGEKKKMLDTCIIIFSKEIYEIILNAYACTKIAEINAPNGTVPIYKFSYKEKEIAFYLSAIGATGTSEYCIEANWLTGAEKFIMFGSAGDISVRDRINKKLKGNLLFRRRHTETKVFPITMHRQEIILRLKITKR